VDVHTTDRSRGSRWRIARVAAWLACASLSLSASVAAGGDADLGKFLLKAGRSALDKNQYEDAVTKLEEARRKDTALIEATYWAAVAYEKKGDTSVAVQRYRDFLLELAAKTRSGGASREETQLAKKVENKLDALDGPSRDLERLQGTFVEQAMAFAKGQQTKDPEIAALAARYVLAIRPAHEEALRLSGPGGARPAGSASVDEYEGIRVWKDLIGGRSLGENEGWVYASDHLVIDRQAGGIALPSSALDSGDRWAYETEIRILETHPGPPWMVGLVFGNAGGESFMAMVGASIVVLNHSFRGTDQDIAKIDLEPISMDVPHRLAVIAKDNLVEIRLDGKMQIQKPILDHGPLKGNYGIFVQSCKVDVRRLRMGKPK
jgi:hypothetical protein